MTSLLAEPTVSIPTTLSGRGTRRRDSCRYIRIRLSGSNLMGYLLSSIISAATTPTTASFPLFSFPVFIIKNDHAQD
jgi:hypothetical protein